MEPSERFNLGWDGFMANAGIAYRELRGKDDFSDLTLVGGDGKQVRAHQVIMAGGSSFFHKILRENPHPHPLIYLKDVKYEHLSSLLDFVYTGEANIVEDHLNEFLHMAEDLNVKGLTLEKSDDQHPKLHPTTPASLQGCKAQELGSPRKVSFQDPKATNDRAPALEVSQPRSVTSAPSQGPAETEVNPGLKHQNVMSTAHQGNVATEGRAPASGVAHLHNAMLARQSKAATEERSSTNPYGATSSSSSNDEDHDDTYDVKVEVGNDSHYYGTNENGEHCISDVSLRVGDKTGGAVLSTEQEENGKPLSTEQQFKEEDIESFSNMDVMKADDGTDIMYKDEQSIHDWYERSEGNDMIIAQDEDNHNEVDSNYDMGGNEGVESAFVNEELAHNSCDDNMMADVEQDPLLPLEKEDFQHSFTSSDLKRNKRSHALEKALQCLVCLKMFSSSSSLSQHKRLHTAEKPYQCPHCPKTFSDKSNLEKHQRVHTGEKPYQCLYCSKTFSHSNNLKKHKRVHTGEKPYQCPHCPKTFKHSSTLKTHKRVHTGEKPYQCPHCSKTFSDKSNLERHQRVHTGEKPYQCPHCPKTFSHSSNLKEHKRVHTGENPYQCLHCSKSFSYKSNLEQHQRVHTGENPYQYPHCPKTFAKKSNMERHKKVHSGGE